MVGGAARRVEVGPFPLDDFAPPEVVGRIVRAAARGERTYTTAGLHVAALHNSDRLPFLEALRGTDLIYPDGASFVVLGRIAGARKIARTPLTDVGHGIVHELVASKPDARIYLLGGPDGLAARAGSVLEATHRVTVRSTHGYHEQWEAVLEEIRSYNPHLLFVGMGLPLETEWIARHADALPAVAAVGCGGWFGHLTGTERRAPEIFKSAGLEWVWRLAQDPRRLFHRYAGGAVLVLRLAVVIARRRWRRRK